MIPAVTFLITSLDRGGAEIQVAQLAIELRRRGWDATVVSLLPRGPVAETLDAAGVPVFSLNMRPGSPNPVALLRLAGVLRKTRPQILHCHLFHANLLGRLARLICPVPAVISTLHSLAETSRRGGDSRSRDRLYRLTDPLTDVTVAVCEAVAIRHAAARVIPNGVDLARFHPSAEARHPNTEFTWLAAGRLMWKKDYATMLRAFAIVRTGTLLIAGAGPQEADLRALVAELGANVRFLGARTDLPDLMRAADGFLLSSTIEGLPVTLLEAAACALPAVATTAGGCTEIIVDGETGFLVPPGDPAAFAAAMTRLAALAPADRLRMGEAARARVAAHFDLAAIVTRWERLYEELLAS
jgi:glycosyltransferase involved in cell wall biosynthesis